jgi:hypothetical protein
VSRFSSPAAALSRLPSASPLLSVATFPSLDARSLYTCSLYTRQIHREDATRHQRAGLGVSRASFPASPEGGTYRKAEVHVRMHTHPTGRDWKRSGED